MNELIVFKNPSFGSVRTFLRNGAPWFVANDVATALGYAVPKNAVAQHCKYAELLRGTDLPPLENANPFGTKVIPESDVYALIFRSNLPKAEEFRRWVCEEVLPSIRKTGHYGLPDFADPVAAAEAWIERYKSEQAALAENKRLALENAEQAKTITKQADTIDDLEVALGDNRDWKAVTAIPWLKDYFINTGTYVLSRVGKVLARMSRQAAVEIRKAPDKRWNTVNVYHVTVIARFHRMLDDDPALLADIRK